MKMIKDGFCFIYQRFFLILWISLVTYLFYNTFLHYLNGRQFYHLRRILGLGLCISRGTATVLNLCSALVLLPLCKKLNQVLYHLLSYLCPGLFFYWLERAKSFHMTVAMTLVLFAVIHSISHFINMWNFSRGYDDERVALNFATYRNENPFVLLLTVAGLTGVSMLLIIISMGLTSLRVVRRNYYNAFWYTHQLFFLFLVLLIVHPLRIRRILFSSPISTPSTPFFAIKGTLSYFKINFISLYQYNQTIQIDIVLPDNGEAKRRVMILSEMASNRKSITVRQLEALLEFVAGHCDLAFGRVRSKEARALADWLWREMKECGVLKEEVLFEDEVTPMLNVEKNTNDSTIVVKERFVSIQSKTWLWMTFPLSCFVLDFVWRIFSRNRAKIDILEVNYLPGRVISLSVSCPGEEFLCRMGQYVLLQCLDVSLLEWHPFTIVKMPFSSQNYFVLWIRVKGDWTEAFESLLLERGPDKLRYPRSHTPGRVHLFWIVRHEEELTWLAELASKTMTVLREANRPDRLHIELYVTNSKQTVSFDKQKDMITVVNGRGDINNVTIKCDEDEKAALLNADGRKHNSINDKTAADGGYRLAKEYPMLGCRVRWGRPHWDRVFGYWVHLYPEKHLHLYCCGPKKLVKLLRNKCKYISRTTKTNFTFVHEGFS
ncbi:unnamed protein product [Diatraea saccharalis]|uniref:FAD-binding FR-type domain-containing protein n=1 Tax=Diatraea saccharalis TaxID=40085 RepID=A0A9N9QUF7_9NEOP|nr:unnamed protein product [Diatraea saccharalis]